MKITLPDTLAAQMALFPKVDFQKMAVEAIGKYVAKSISA